MDNEGILNRLDGEKSEITSSAEIQINNLIEKYRIELNIITSLRQSAQADADQINSQKNITDEYVKKVNDARHFSEENSSEINNLRTAAAANAQAIAENIKNIEIAKTSSAKDVELIKKDRDESQKALESAKQNQLNTQSIANIVDEQDGKVKEYQEQLIALTENFTTLNNRVENLLPGATSAGLASAFQARKEAFRPSIILWGCVFLGSIAGLIAVGFYMLQHYSVPTSLQEWLLRAVTKSPILVALLVLEEFSRRHYNIALRVEEDYAYKEVLSRSFEGYNKQMKEIASTPYSAAGKLSDNLLEALKLHPGRYIEKDRSRIPGLLDQFGVKHPDQKS